MLLFAGDRFGAEKEKYWERDDPAMKSPNQDLDVGMRDEDEEALAYPGRRLTMIPARYKLKEERRKVLKISINKLKKIDDPESWLCRSVLINNTMRKLQKEARDEKMQKQMNVYAKSYFLDGTECQLNNNNCKDSVDNCAYQSEDDKCTNKLESSLSSGVSLNEDVVEKIPSIKRCASRKRSLDEDGPASDILMDKDESDMDTSNVCGDVDRTKPSDIDDMEDCDVHDVLSQLYLPPTPRLLTTIDSDTEDDDLNVVDIDASYIEEPKSDEYEVPSKKPKLDAAEVDDSFFSADKVVLPERTCGAKEEEEVIELEDEEDIKRRLSQSLSGYRKGEAFFEEPNPSLDTCDNLYSCGHTSLFTDMQTVTFHNLIASLET